MPDAWAWLCVPLAPALAVLTVELTMRWLERQRPRQPPPPEGVPQPFDPAELGGGEVVRVVLDNEGKWRRADG